MKLAKWVVVGCAGLLAGWIAYELDHWYTGFWGLFGTLPGRLDPLSMVEFHVNSVVLALVFAWLHRRLPGPGWMKGLVYGMILHFGFLLFWFLGRMGGADIFMKMHVSVELIAGALIFQLVYGFWVGVICGELLAEA
jgi:chromate transport protein ChrA